MSSWNEIKYKNLNVYMCILNSGVEVGESPTFSCAKFNSYIYKYCRIFPFNILI